MEPRRISHYELKRLVGKGGMGEVYEAEDLDLGRRRVALKFVAPDLAADPESLKRFEREAVSAARLKHPNIAVVHAFVPDPAAPFIDMELIEGGSLRAMLDRGALSLDQSLSIARDVASALAHAHARGIIHRDIKPENLMFDADGTLKVMDFGLARAVEGSRLTQDGSSLGTPSYMAPEAIRGEPTAASDLFALGVMMHEMIAGRLPFGGDKPLAVLYNIMNERPRPLLEDRPDAPPAVASLVGRLLAKDAAQRPDAAAVARELAALLGAAPPRTERTTEELETQRMDSGEVLRESDRLASVRAPALTTAGGSDESATLPMAVPVLPVPATPARPARPSRRPAAALFAFLGLALAGAAAVVWFALGAGGRGERSRQEALAFNNRGSEMLRAGELDSAIVLFERALDRSPGFGPAQVNLGVARHRRGETDAAVALLTQVVERHPRDSTLAAQAEFELGSIELDSGNPPVAVPHFERAVALEPANPGYANNLAFALVQVGRPAEALAQADRMLAIFPNDPFLLKNKALALLALERPAEALPVLERAARADATLASPRGWSAVARAMTGDRAAATAEWDAYRGLGPAEAERAEIARRLEALGVAAAAR